MSLDKKQSRLSKVSHGHRPFMREPFALQLNSLDFMQCIGFEIAFSAMGTGNHRNIFNHKEVPAFPVSPRYLSNSYAGLSTNITRHRALWDSYLHTFTPTDFDQNAGVVLPPLLLAYRNRLDATVCDGPGSPQTSYEFPVRTWIKLRSNY
jgi:hypothetical protein